MAAHISLPKDATLRSVVPTLDDKVDFVRKAFGVINRYHRSHGAVILRIGVSSESKGKRPNYRIDLEETKKHIAAIDGNTHKPWEGADASAQGDWSTAAMTHGQVRDLLGELR